MTTSMFDASSTFQTAWDNSSLTLLKDCPRKYKYAIIDGWRPKGPSAPLVFGSAWHEVVELFDKIKAEGRTTREALHASIQLAFKLSENWQLNDTARTRESLVRSIIWYSDEFANDVLETHIFSNGRVALEMSFRFVLPFTTANEELIYCGHIDKIARYAGQLYAVERKTTKLTLGSYFFDKYFFSSQVTGYAYAGKVVFEEQLAGAIIDATQVGVNFSSFGRAVVNRVESHLEEWMQDLQIWIGLAKQFADANYWPHNTESCGKYSGCQFRGVCQKAPAIRQLVLETEFMQDRWNPLANRGED